MNKGDDKNAENGSEERNAAKQHFVLNNRAVGADLVVSNVYVNWHLAGRVLFEYRVFGVAILTIFDILVKKVSETGGKGCQHQLHAEKQMGPLKPPLSQHFGQNAENDKQDRD